MISLDVFIRKRSCVLRTILAIPVFLHRSGGILFLAGIGDAPDRAAGIIGDEQGTILAHGERSRAAPHLSALLARYPEAGDEVLV